LKAEKKINLAQIRWFPVMKREYRKRELVMKREYRKRELVPV